MASEQERLLVRTRELASSGDFDGALAGYAELCAREPYNPDLWLERAGIAESAGRVDDAVDILFHVADLFAQAGMSEAAEIAERVLALAPDHDGAQQFLQMFEARRLGPYDVVPHAIADAVSDGVPRSIGEPAEPDGWGDSAIPLPSVDLPSGPVRIVPATASGPGPVASAGATVQVQDGPFSAPEVVGRPVRSIEFRRRPTTPPPVPASMDDEWQRLPERLARLSSPLLDALDEAAVRDLIDACSLHRRRVGEAVFHQDDAGSSLYLVLDGTALVERREEASGTLRKLALLEAGAFFGEMALLAGVPRSATVRAASDVTLLKLSRHSVRRLAERDNGLLDLLTRFFRARLVGTLMATSPLFQPLSRAERRELAACFRLRQLPPDCLVLRQGRLGDGLYLALVGTLTASVVDTRGRKRTLGTLGPGEVFGEMSLLSGEPVMATIRTAESVWLLRLPGDDFARVVRDHPEMGEHLRAIADARRATNRKLGLGG